MRGHNVTVLLVRNTHLAKERGDNYSCRGKTKVPPRHAKNLNTHGHVRLLEVLLSIWNSGGNKTIQ